MKDFFRFPRTPHLAWLGEGAPRDDKRMKPSDVEKLLANELIVEEKLDGANLGICVDRDGAIRVQSRGQYLLAPYAGQFVRLGNWLGAREESLREALGTELILFGEWCAARHSLDYQNLPDWFLAFDVYDVAARRFLNTRMRHTLAKRAGVAMVPLLLADKASLTDLVSLVLHRPSHFRDGPMEGIVVRTESKDWLETRAKLVHPAFTQAISQHWSRRQITWNRLVAHVPQA